MAQTVTMVRFDKGPVAAGVEAMAMGVDSRSASSAAHARASTSRALPRSDRAVRRSAAPEFLTGGEMRQIRAVVMLSATAQPCYSA